MKLTLEFATGEELLKFAERVYGSKSDEQGAVTGVSIPSMFDNIDETLAELEAPQPPGALTEVPVAPSAPLTSEVDSTGMPWDARIHSSGKSFLKSGQWKPKRGVDDALVAQVRAELTGGSPVAQPEVAPEPPQAPVMPQVPPAAPVAAQQTPAAPMQAPSVPIQPPATPASSAQAAGVNAQPGTFLWAMTEISRLGVTNEARDAALNSLGLADMPSLAGRPDLIPTFMQALGAGIQG